MTIRAASNCLTRGPAQAGRESEVKLALLAAPVKSIREGHRRVPATFQSMIKIGSDGTVTRRSAKTHRETRPTQTGSTIFPRECRREVAKRPVRFFTLMTVGIISFVDSSFRITFLRFGQATIRVRIAHPTPAENALPFQVWVHKTVY